MKTILGKEPAVVIGGLFAGLTVLANLVFGGGFDDGVSLVEVVSVVAPIAAGVGIRISVDSPATVAAKVAEARKRR